MQEILLKIRYFERWLSKTLKKLTLFFLSNSVPLNDKDIKNRPGASDQSLFRLQEKFTNFFFLSYTLSDLVSPCNIKWFLSFANLCQPIHEIMNYSIFVCPFESGKCGKKGKRLQKFECLENKKSFLDEIKSIFHSFRRAIIW